jgi:hypothetical protein
MPPRPATSDVTLLGEYVDVSGHGTGLAGWRLSSRSRYRRTDKRNPAHTENLDDIIWVAPDAPRCA